MSGPAEERPAQAEFLAAGAASAGLMPQGLSWSWQLDFDALLSALSEPEPWHRSAPLQASPATAEREAGAETTPAPTAPARATRARPPPLGR